MNTTTVADAPNNGKRKRIFMLLGAIFIVAAIAYALYYFLVAIHYESTDDAYVQGNVVQVTPQIAGTVLAIRADDTDFVKAGQELVVLDKADAQVALDQAEAQLAQTVREVRTLYANNNTLNANIAAKEADLARARSEYDRAEEDFRRRQALVATGAVSKEELQHVQSQLADAKSVITAAQAAVAAAREQLSSNQTLTEGTDVAQHPNVQRAAGRVREAYLALARASLPAPVSGQIAKRSVQVGQRVQPGAPLMAIVPLDNLWVDANFKEVQLRQMRIGQPVTLEADVYGGKAEYHGKLVGLSAGTGSAFSLLPAQNATGNWIKVVQRVPVRIALDPKELQAHPLRVGLSMDAKVDITDQSGQQLASASRTEPTYQTQAFQAQSSDAAANEIVNRIIAANLGKGASVAAATQSTGSSLQPVVARQGARKRHAVSL